jgi:polyvinyl alcohol dehydrogenase (cytochrome)
LYEGRLYVPVTGLDEVESNSPNFLCCSARGIIVALNAETGKQIWKTYTIEETPKVIKKMSSGRDVWGPSGAGVWNTPTIDPKRRAIYFGTGNGFTGPATKTSDAIMALDLDTGKVLWSFQATANDIWHSGCPQGQPGVPNAGRGARGGAPGATAGAPNAGRAPAGPPREDCIPGDPAPDWDFSASPMLVSGPEGRPMIVAGQKSGAVWALDPDNKGAVIWKYAASETRGRVGIVFGGAADDQNAYFNSRPGIYAVRLSDGVEKWFTPLPPPAEAMKDHPGASAAVSAITGAVFSVGLDGMVRALASNDGKLLWEFNTAQDFKTVNGVTAKGGSIGAGGVAVSNGMIFVASGYVGFQNGAPGNVLLAFAPAQ